MPHVPGYDLVEAVGEGGSATLWRAIPSGGGPQVAVKLGRAATAYARERFAAEAAALQQVGPPHTPRLFAAGETADGAPYLVMELFETGTLEDQLAALTAPPSPARVRELAEPLAIALEAIHARGIVHRDLKPANVFVRGNPPACAVTDFGLALDAAAGSDRMTRTGVAVGTPHYVAPEQLAAGDVDHRADLYSFGVILYRIATLTLPFDGPPDVIEYGHHALRPPPPGQRAPVGALLEQLIGDCLAKQPGERPAGAAAVRERLIAACAEAPATRRTRPRGRSRERRAVAAATGREPVALLAVDTDAAALPVIERVARRGGTLITQGGRRYVFGFLAGDDDQPLDAAIASARELATELGVAVAVHLDDAIVRRRGAIPSIYSEAIDDPGAIAPPPGVAGVVLTRRAAELARADIEPYPAAAEWFRIAAAGSAPAARRQVPLIGRDPLLVEAEASFAGCCARARPAVWLLIGESGTGRSRICREVAERVRRARPDARVIEISGRDEGEVTGAAARARDAAARQPVALIVDDLHRASNRALDLLDHAALDGAGVTLWIAAAAAPRLDAVRPGWGMFAAQRDRAELSPLDEAAAVELAAALLAPADYPARGVLRALAAWAGHRPGPLEELVRALIREGHIRPRERGEGHYLAAPDIEALTRAPIAQWLAARELAGLAPPVAELLEICSALDAPFSRGEVEAIQLALASDDPARPLVDAGVAVDDLCRRGVLHGDPGALAFRSSLVGRGVHAGLSAARRAAIHGAAAAVAAELPGAGRSIPALARRARHAAHATDPAAAAEALLALGQAQLAAHRDTDAAASFGRAVDAAAGPAARATALLWRGRARTRIDQVDPALVDLGLALELARELGDRALETEILLEQAVALDWAERFDEADEARQAADRARAGLDDMRFEALALAARGRSHWRSNNYAEAVADLDAAAALGRRAGCYDAEVVAATVGPLALLRLGDRERARERFDEAEQLFAARGDDFHLAALLVNRMVLWSAIDERDRGRDDLRRAIALARELGQPQLERGALFNLAEDLHWSGEPEPARELAERSLVLQRRYFPAALPVDALLVARIDAAEGELERALSVAEPLTGDDPSFEILRAAVIAAARGATDARWIALCDRAQAALPPDEALEVRYLAARSLHGDARQVHRDAARPLLAQCRIWHRRFDQLPG